MDSIKKLSGKTALVTGAGRGVGRGISLEFAAAGASLVLLARTPSELDETAASCQKLGAAVTAEVVDLARPEEIARLFEQLTARKVTVDCLVNNAAILIKSVMEGYNRDDFARMLAVNLTAPLLLTQHVIPLMKPRGGTIVNISSLSGCFGVPKFAGFGAYNISKYGLWGLTEILAIELRQYGIRVNQLSLSAVDTAMFRSAAPPGLTADLAVEQVARQALYLASADSDPLTGQNIILTGSPTTR